MSLNQEQIKFVEKAIDKTLSQPFKAMDEKGNCKYCMEKDGLSSCCVVGNMIDSPQDVADEFTGVYGLFQEYPHKANIPIKDIRLLQKLQQVHDSIGGRALNNVSLLFMDYPELKVIEPKLKALAEW